jgi:hypothetical protein
MITLLLPLALATEWRDLHAAGAQATSYLRADQGTTAFHPNHAVDGDETTAWMEGAKGDGVGEYLEWSFAAVSGAKEVQLVIKPGFQQGWDSYFASAAPKEVEITLLGVGGEVVHTQKAVLVHSNGYQPVELAVPADKVFSGARVKVLSAWPGSIYQDVGISDVSLQVRGGASFDEAADQAKANELVAWGMQERAAPQPGLPSAFASMRFAETTLEPESSCDAGAAATRLPSHRVAFKDLKRSRDFYSVSARERLEMPNETGLGPLVSSLLLAPNLELKPAKDEVARTITGDESFAEQTVMSNVRVAWRDEAHTTPSAMYVWTKTSGVERGPWEYRIDYLITFDTSGRAGTLYATHQGSDKGHDEQLSSVTWEAGKVVGTEVLFYDPRDSSWEKGEDPYCTITRYAAPPAGPTPAQAVATP